MTNTLPVQRFTPEELALLQEMLDTVSMHWLQSAADILAPVSNPEFLAVMQKFKLPKRWIISTWRWLRRSVTPSMSAI